MALTVADIRAYGATEASADNTAAFTLAMAAIPNDTGGIFYVPKGTWKGRIQTKPGVTIRGAGDPASTIKLPNSANADVITKTSGQGQFIKIEQLRVDGNSANNSSGRGIVLDTLYVTSGLHSVSVVDCAGKGIVLADSDEFILFDVWVNNCGDIGLELTQCTEVRMFAVASERSGSPCMKFIRCDTVTGSGHLGVEQTTGSGKKGIIFDSCIGVDVRSAYLYGGPTPGTHLTAVEWNSTTTPGRAARYSFANITSGAFTNTFVDSVNSYTVTADNVGYVTDNQVTLTAGALNPKGPLDHDGSTVGFYGATPTAKAGATSDLKDALVNLGLVTDGGATPLNLDAGTLTAGATNVTTLAASGAITLGGDATLERSAADVLSTNDDFRIATAGKGLKVAEGSNAKMGTATLSAGAATVSTTAVTANSRIFLTNNTPGGTPGHLRVSARVNGTSFTITSSEAGDTSTIAWMLVEPA